MFDSFAHAHDWINAKVDKFNNSPHSELPRVTDAETGKRRHQTPAEAKAEAIAAGFEPVRLDESTLIDLFRIHVKRKEIQIEAIQARMDPDRMPVEARSLEMQSGQVLDFGQRLVREALTVPAQSGFAPPGLTQQADEPRTETPDEAQMRWYAEEAERAERERTEAQDDGEDRLFLMMRAEQDERDRQEQEESERRKAM